MKRILIAGGAGFIGAHLSRFLLAQGHHITIADDFSTGSKNNIADLIAQPNCALLERDIIEPLACKAEQIYNLACPASPVAYQRDPIRTLLVSVMGTQRLLELVRANNARFLQASTSEIYGDPKEHPQRETYLGNVNPIGPRACYDEGKRAAETLCFDYHRQHKIEIKVARIFNTYGPGMAKDDGRVVTNFLHQAMAGQPITLYGDGAQTRSFCYVDDMVRGLVALMESEAKVTGPINLGNPDEFTIEELAELVIELTGSSSSLTRKPLPQDDPMQRQPDITLAKKLLGWEPKVKLRQGLEKMIAQIKRKAA